MDEAPSVERIDLAALPAVAWKNGAGLTQEVAVEPRGAGFDGFDWRLSVARLDRNATFSVFPGIDRCIALLDGDGMALCDPDGTVVHGLVEAGRPWVFDGALDLRARLRGGPCRDMNVMTRRGRSRATVRLELDDCDRAAGHARFLLAIAGRWAVKANGSAPVPMTIMSGQALLWRCAAPALRARADGPARLLAVDIDMASDAAEGAP